MPKFWNGSPGACDFCKRKLDEVDLFYDVALLNGPWANLCPECFRATPGLRIELGRGQCYQKETSEDGTRWRKIAG